MNFIEKAINLSIENVSKNKGGPFGAVIVRDNEIVSEGYNNVITNSDPTAHAEIVAIRNACKKLNTPFLENCTIYSSCEPCPMCYGAIKWAKIKKIYYCNTREQAKNIGFDDEKIYNNIIYNNQNMIKIDHNHGLTAFNKWKESESKIEY